MAPQFYDWTCSACSLDWVKVACGLAPYSDRYATTLEIGYTQNISPAVGLHDASGWALREVLLRDYGQETAQGWLDFDTVYDLAQGTTGMMSGAAYYHWVALRGVQGNNIWIANSAVGYKGVWDVLSRSDWDRLGGWSVVWLV